MKSIITSQLRTTLIVIGVAAFAGCTQAPEEDGGDDEAVAVAQEAVIDQRAIQSYFGATDFSAFASTRSVTNPAPRPVLLVPKPSHAMLCPSDTYLGVGTCLCKDLDHCPSWDGNVLHPVLPYCNPGEENAGLVCYGACPDGYAAVGPGPLGCSLSNFSEGLAETFYNSTFQSLANNTGLWYFYGTGVTAGAGAETAIETGVIYGPDNQFGYYTSHCEGFVTNIGASAYVVMGGIRSKEDFVGDARDWSVGIDTPIDFIGVATTVTTDETGKPVGSSSQVSVGVGVSPIEFSTSTCDTTYTELHRLRPLDAPDGGTGNTFYTVGSNGNFYRTRHLANGDFDRVNVQIGDGWNIATHLFAAEGGHVYMTTGDGHLRYYHFDESTETFNVVGQDVTVDAGSAVVPSTGWVNMSNVWAGRFGEIYAVKANGDLVLYKHDGNLKIFSQQTIGIGWNEGSIRQVFSGGHNTVYLITTSGDLVEYLHDDSGAFYQVQTIGIGWTAYDHVGSTGNGEIYAVEPNGDLHFYRHLGGGAWADASGVKIGSGWAPWVSSYGLIASAY